MTLAVRYALMLSAIAFYLDIVSSAVSGGLHVSKTMDTNGSPDLSFSDASNAHVNLIRLYVVLDKSGGDRSQLVASLKKNFDAAAAAGVKLIMRFYYDGGEADLNTIKNDLNMLVPVMKGRSDAIYSIQAGFLGQNWGEWWGGKLGPDADLGTDPAVKEAKETVVQSLKQTGLPVQVRYPRDIANYFAGDVQVGIHDDCILSEGPDGSDSGTFEKASAKWKTGDLSTVRQFLKAAVLSVKGGEGCTDGFKCPDFLAFVKLFGLSYLNAEFPESLHSDFKNWDPSDSSSCMSQLQSALQANAARYSVAGIAGQGSDGSSGTPAPAESPSTDTPTPTPSSTESSSTDTPTPTPSPTESSSTDTPTPTPSPSSSPSDSPTPASTPSTLSSSSEVASADASQPLAEDDTLSEHSGPSEDKVHIESPSEGKVHIENPSEGKVHIQGAPHRSETDGKSVRGGHGNRERAETEADDQPALPVDLNFNL